MSEEPRQLPLDLPFRAALGAEDFLVSQSNAAAVALVEQWPDWGTQWALIHGPVGSGKTHLLSVWRARSGAAIVAASTLDDATVENFEAGGALAIDDIDRGLSNERILFHLLNRARETRGAILMTACNPPGALEAQLPDLRSRFKALASAEIAPPDDALLQSLLVKLFSDRQINVEPAVVQYLVRHMDRSAESAIEIVDEIDRISLADRRKVSRVLAARVIQERNSR